MSDNADKRFAVLIDADNVSEKYIKPIMDELNNKGTITYRRIYGDWTKPTLSKWKGSLLDHAITPMQQYGYTTGKNSTDSALIIDAMDILYSGNIDGFCIVSSDSDFTRLATRLRESGMIVVGMGEKKTPLPFIHACTEFKYLEILDPKQSAFVASDELTADKIQIAIIKIINEVSDEDGWAPLSHVGNILAKRYPSFDVRHFGFLKLMPFIESMGEFEIRSDKSSATRNLKVVYIRKKTE
jgi:uncharacterized LabA/DUF88 family protein